MERTEKSRAEISYYDSWVESFKICITKEVKLTEEIVAVQNLVMVTMTHKDVDYQMVQRNANVIFDTKNVMKAVGKNVEVL